MEIFVMAKGDKDEMNYLGDLLYNYNLDNVPLTQDEPFKKICYTMKDRGGNIKAGIVGTSVLWDILYIDVVWVDKEYRDKDLGSKLLKKIEKKAMEMGCYISRLETFSFQAKEFYEKQGYKVFGELEDVPKGHTNYFMKKDLI